jgi:PKD repeat protein
MIKILKYSLLLLSCVSLISSCKKSSSDTPPATPVASFTYSFTISAYAPAQVGFTNTSTNAATYNWDYGDGNSSTVFSGTHTYAAGGDYTVTLTATGNGGSNTATTAIHVLNSPTIAKITSIQLTAYPAHDSTGANWDASDGPDIYFRIYKDTSIVANYDTTVFNNRTSPPVLLDLGANPFQVSSSSFTTIYSIAIFDKDSLPPDPLMGTMVGFSISDYTTTNPSSFNVTYDNSIKFTLGISWQ